MEHIKQIKKYYSIIQKPLAYFCLGLASIATVIGITSLQLGGILALGFIILQLLLDIHSKLIEDTTKKSRVYDNYTNAFPEMKRIIEQETQNNNQAINLIWIGTCMDVGWLFLNRYLQEVIRNNNSNAQVLVKISMLNYQWNKIEKINKFWIQETQKNYESIIDFKKRLSKTNITIELSIYEHMPYYTGLLINDKYLFLGLCQWSDEGYGVGDNQYILLDKKDANGEMQINQYLRWFSFCSGKEV
jgi:hypothetical protein